MNFDNFMAEVDLKKKKLILWYGIVFLKYFLFKNISSHGDDPSSLPKANSNSKVGVG